MTSSKLPVHCDSESESRVEDYREKKRNRIREKEDKERKERTSW